MVTAAWKSTSISYYTPCATRPATGDDVLLRLDAWIGIVGKEITVTSIIMRSITACCSAAIFLVHTSNAFTSPSSITSLSRVNYYGSSQQQYQQQVVAKRPPILFANHINEDELLPSLQFITKQSQPKNLEKKSSSVRQRIKAFGQLAIERTNTLKAAGLYDKENGLMPMQAGFKTNVGLLVGAFLFKWYRARFINKIPVWDRQPQWYVVVCVST